MEGWESFPWGPLITIGVLFLTVALLAMDERNRKKFASRGSVCGPDGSPKFPLKEEVSKDINEMGRKIERNAGLFVSLDDRVGDLEEKTALLEERQSQHWGRFSEQMQGVAETMREVTREMKEISKMQQEFALRLERVHNSKGE